MTRRQEETHIYIFFSKKYFSVLTFISSVGTILNKSLVDIYSIPHYGSYLCLWVNDCMSVNFTVLKFDSSLNESDGANKS